MRATTRERLTANPHRSLLHTPPEHTPGAVLVDQTGAKPVPILALNALDTPDTVFAEPSPFRDGVLLVGASNSDAELAQLPPTFCIAGSPHLYAGPCVIVAHDPTEGTVPLTLDEVFYVLRNVYIMSTTDGPDAHVVWLVALGEVGGC